MTRPAVSPSGLREQYGELTAVDSLDLGIRQEEISAVLGFPRGAGAPRWAPCGASYSGRG
ncbi:hypothetical protein [Streptomyces sp. NPDC002889]|uniref:hypothetical protein n=1 Tax=Streptomyces sp. NPDC002889 TaxID=3364669 RepID=UPI00368338FA